MREIAMSKVILEIIFKFSRASMNTEKVSVIIPVHNVEPYLSKCMSSAISQDYENIEVIAVDDGSTDGSLRILREFEAISSKLIVRSIPNQGQSVARNLGLEIATGDYVLFLDSDDWIEPRTVSICMSKIRSHQVEIVFFSASSFCDGVDDELSQKFIYDRKVALQNKVFKAWDFFYKSVQLGNYIVSPCLYLYNRERLGAVKFPPGVLHEDNLFTTRLLLQDKDNSVYCIPDQLFHRRVRPNSTMTQAKQDKHTNGYLKVAEELLRERLARENNEASKALNYFAQTMLTSAIITHHSIYGNRYPLRLRAKLISLVRQLNPRFLRPKAMLLSIVPDLLVLK